MEGMVAVEQLADDLPSEVAFGSESSIEDQARAVLSLLVDRIKKVSLVTDRKDADPSTCPNCGIEVASTRSPYCGEPCREMASFVRQFRTGLAAGWILDREKQIALGQNLWHVLGGGRPLRQSLILGKPRQKVIGRDGGKCQVCGAVATTVDHVRTGCNRPINLRAVCDACCTARPFGECQILDKAQAKFDEIAQRIASAKPVRACDDAETWDWRAYLKTRVGR